MQKENSRFDPTDLIKAISIIGAFETGKAFGRFSTVAVLDDGAGISYGFSQFTHRSGSLAVVLEKYLSLGGALGAEVIRSRMPVVRRTTKAAIDSLSDDRAFRNALRAAGITREMREAQLAVAIERYVQPAISECVRLGGFNTPLSLAVIYDSMIHGSWERLASKVRVTPLGVTIASKDATHTLEQEWITEYVHRRDQWLASVPRLAKTRYRTKFFLDQIARGNWELRLPLKPNGVAITQQTIDTLAQYLGGPRVPQTVSTAGPDPQPSSQQQPQNNLDQPSQTPQPPARPSETTDEQTRREGDEETQAEGRPVINAPEQAETRAVARVSNGNQTSSLDQLESQVNAAAARYDQVERIATTITRRNDAAKSLWTTVVGSVTQTFWALFGLAAGIPREVWLVVAVIAALLMLMYLYRQITLGKIREAARL